MTTTAKSTLLFAVYLILWMLIFIRLVKPDDDLIFSPIFENRPQSKSLQEIKNNLQNVYNKQDKKETLESNTLSELQDKNKEKAVSSTERSNLRHIKEVLSKFLSKLKRNKRKKKSLSAESGQSLYRDKRKEKIKSGEPKFQKWTDWSTCSVTCGKGRMIRWRHCKSSCKDVDTEMEEISCQLPECPRKLFGVFKL